MNWSETYFELNSEEATHCHLICCVYIKGHVSIQMIKAMHVHMCDVEGSKEALTVLIVTHVEWVKSGVCSFYTTE